jgi:hypothetical protein
MISRRISSFSAPAIASSPKWASAPIKPRPSGSGTPLVRFLNST